MTTEWLDIFYWVMIVLFAGGSLALAALAWTRQAVWVIAASAGFLVIAIIITSFPGPGSPPFVTVLLTLIGIALAVIGGGPAATVSLKLATRGSVVNGEHGGILVETEPREVLRGGLAIGVLERLAVIGSIVAGFPAGLAVIVAVKGVGRFSELDAAEARERFIIGTFVSLIWACACAALVVLAVH